MVDPKSDTVWRVAGIAVMWGLVTGLGFALFVSRAVVDRFPRCACSYSPAC